MQVLFRSPVNAESLASGSAGACEAIFTNPFEIIKIRLRMKDAAMRDAVCEGETFTKRSLLWIVRNVAGEKSHSQQLFHTAGSNGRQRVLYDDPVSRNGLSLPGCRWDETIIASPGYGQLSDSPPLPHAPYSRMGACGRTDATNDVRSQFSSTATSLCGIANEISLAHTIVGQRFESSRQRKHTDY